MYLTRLKLGDKGHLLFPVWGGVLYPVWNIQGIIVLSKFTCGGVGGWSLPQHSSSIAFSCLHNYCCDVQ